jgi:hypothetical protein
VVRPCCFGGVSPHQLTSVTVQAARQEMCDRLGCIDINPIDDRADSSLAAIRVRVRELAGTPVPAYRRYCACTYGHVAVA